MKNGIPIPRPGVDACSWCGKPGAPICGDECRERLRDAEQRCVDEAALGGSRGSRPPPPFDGRHFSPWRGPNGRRACRWCGVEVPKSRRGWCSDACVAAYLGTDWIALRKAVWERDGGRCQICRVAPEEIRARVLAGTSLETLGESRAWPADRTREWWEADHVVPVVLGGVDSLENLRVLCVPCHKAVTAELARRRAEERRDARVGARLPFRAPEVPHARPTDARSDASPAP